jgi:predicted O-methyltransferase YrrM
VHQSLEELRKTLLSDTTLLEIQDYGAGSKTQSKKVRSIAAIAKTSLITPYWGQLLNRLTGYLQPKQVVELGTCLGLGTLYLTSGLPANTPVYTFEGAANLVHYSEENILKHAIQAVQILEGNIDETLPAFLKTNKEVDFFYVDANHTYEATLRYFHLILENSPAQAVVVLDDIHWSKGMHEAWKEISALPDVGLSIDLFRLGLVFKQSPTGEKTQQVWEF